MDELISKQELIKRLEELKIPNIEEYHQNNQAVNNCIVTVLEMKGIKESEVRV